MKKEEIHIALKNNQQIFKLALIDDLKSSAAQAKSYLKELNTVAYNLEKAQLELGDKQIQLKEASSYNKSAINTALILLGELDDVFTRVEASAKELGVEKTAVKGYTEASKIYDDVIAQLVKNRKQDSETKK